MFWKQNLRKALKFATFKNPISKNIRHTLTDGENQLGHIEYRWSGDISNIVSMEITEEHRLNGHGTRLLSYFENNMKDKGVKEAKVCILPDAKGFYMKNGYNRDDMYESSAFYHKRF
jgi:GNAT superfamily N-acetyltransferase